MNVDQAAVDLDGSLDAKPRASEPGSSYCKHARFDQMPQNYSESQADTLSTIGSHNGQDERRRNPARPLSASEGRKNRARDGSETAITTDDASFYSYHSARDLATFVREFYGRMFNTQSELYMMPSDDSEFERLNKQHYALVLGIDGLFPCSDVVHEILAPRKNKKPKILDLGCGSGIWALEMAAQFPHCEVVGLDLAPVPVDPEVVPINCRFEIDDINLGLRHYHGHFDLIHVRCVGSGLSDHAKMMRDVEACLTPGGLVIFIDGDQTVYQEDMITPIALGQEKDEGGDPNEGSWLYRIAREIRFAAIYNGSDIDGLENCIDRGLWGHELIDPSTVQAASLSTPVGIWAKARDPDTQQRALYAGSLIRQDLLGVSPGWHPMLRKYGIPQETLDKWSRRIEEELTSDKFHMCMRWRFTWGRRLTDDPHSKESTSSPIPSVDSTVEEQHSSSSSPKDFKFLTIYRTQEEAAAVTDLRRQKVKDLPTPMVVRIKNEMR